MPGEQDPAERRQRAREAVGDRLEPPGPQAAEPRGGLVAAQGEDVPAQHRAAHHDARTAIGDATAKIPSDTQRLLAEHAVRVDTATLIVRFLDRTVARLRRPAIVASVAMNGGSRSR